MVVSDTAEKIKKMEIRGAGRIARAAVAALMDHAASATARDAASFRNEMREAAALLQGTRPTAVSLPNAIHRVMRSLEGDTPTVQELRDHFIVACRNFISSSEAAIERIGAIGAGHIQEGDTLLTHCNSEAALACLIAAQRKGISFEVYATEVRPGNQGLLTLKTLNEARIPTIYIVDSAVRSVMREVDRVIVGADAVTVNGAVVNKIGTSQIALAAHERKVSMMVAAETYKFAPRTILGEFIRIEERGPEEVLPAALAKKLPYVRVKNPVFDVTPPEYIDLIVTEEGAIPPQMAYIILRDYLGWSTGDFGGNSPGATENFDV
ncbi:MAG: ribose 1,5-bisphosphate isomerase [Methanoregulaceae archaeon]|jgi:ribose 1,5-bisphosphate isomerase|nr:ribose 1,5-bisphosphate isomerase [Methanoregulaceae archaeon]